MAPSVKSAGSGRSSGSGKTSRSSVTVKSNPVNLPKKTRAMDCILYFAGANPRRISHIRRDRYTNDMASEMASDYGDPYHWTTLHFVQSRSWDYPEWDDGRSVSSSGSKSRKRSSSPRRPRQQGRRKPEQPVPVWNRRQAHVDDDEGDDSQSDSSSAPGSWASDEEYGEHVPPPHPHPQMFHQFPPQPQFFQGPPPGGPPPQEEDADPGFIQIR